MIGDAEYHREALHYFRRAKRLLAGMNTDRLEIEPRLVLRKQADMIVVRWRPHGFTESALVAIDKGDAPMITTFHRGAWMKILAKAVEASRL